MKKSSFPADSALRGRIIGAAFEAFMTDGYAGASMDQIARRARVSKRDLYANFPSKAAVLLACIAERAARMRLPQDLPEPRSREALAAALTAFGTLVVREVTEPAVVAVYRLAISEAARSPDVAKILNASRSVNRHALARLLAKAQAGGVLGHGDPQEMMEQFFGLLWGDLLLSRLLGAVEPPKPGEIGRRSRTAAEAFLALHAKPAPGGARRRS